MRNTGTSCPRVLLALSAMHMVVCKDAYTGGDKSGAKNASEDAVYSLFYLYK